MDPSPQTKLRHQYCCPGGPDGIKVQQPPGLEESLFQVRGSPELRNTPGSQLHESCERGALSVSPMLNVCVCICRYTGTTPNPPPGSHYTSPSENMWNTGAYSMGQGMAVSGEHTQTLLEVHVFTGGTASPLHAYRGE